MTVTARCLFQDPEFRHHENVLLFHAKGNGVSCFRFSDGE